MKKKIKKKLTEGFDKPVECIIMLKPTKSPATFKQGLGRALHERKVASQKNKVIPPGRYDAVITESYSKDKYLELVYELSECGVKDRLTKKSFLMLNEKEKRYFVDSGELKRIEAGDDKDVEYMIVRDEMINHGDRVIYESFCPPFTSTPPHLLNDKNIKYRISCKRSIGGETKTIQMDGEYDQDHAKQQVGKANDMQNNGRYINGRTGLETGVTTRWFYERIKN